MGASRDLSVWILILIISFSNGSVTLGHETRNAPLFDKTVVLFPELPPAQVFTSHNPDHNFRVCSTWGNYHFKTFDGDVYYFPGTCNYVFASQCLSAYEEFNIQMRRSIVDSLPRITQIVLKIDGSVIEVLNSIISVDDNVVTLPHSHSGIMIEKVSNYTRLTAKVGLSLMWNGYDALMLELGQQFVNTTCGLCGDFNGIRDNEYFSNGYHLTPIQYGNLQKLNGPKEHCKDVPSPDNVENCSKFEYMCERALTEPGFSNCHEVLDLAPFIKSCMLDFCLCKDLEKPSSCICDTLSEFSRQCAHVGGKPSNWRRKGLCEETCQLNMIYQECGIPCVDTCSNPDRSQICEDHCIDGCFCAPNTVLDDISNSGCIPKEQCPCTHNRVSYAPGASYSTKCSKCICNGGQWSCDDLPCPAICSIEGGAHINTFDESYYTFHGRCHYVLTKDCRHNFFTVLGELQQCGITDSETCLKSVTLTIDGPQNVITINPSGSVSINGIFTQLPLTTANVTIFKPSNFHVIFHTTFGLQLLVQLVPLMQLYITLDSAFKNRMCGLCGNFNNVLNDEFKIVNGLVEGTPAAFANTWKTKARCPDRKDIHENPCSLSVENDKYAKHWCGLLIADDSAFSQCHSHINPNQYYEQCKYDSCNSEKSEDYMCAALSSYVQACASKGIIISNWRANVCSKYTICPKTLVYSYNMTSCRHTCQSLEAPDKTCEIDFVPVDGCGCADGTYMEDTGKCVPRSSCPCYHRGSVVPAGEVIHEEDALCTCDQGKLECIGKELKLQACFAPMVYFDCSNASAESTGTECEKSCQTLEMECYATGCTSGCVCPEGLVSDESGGCIPISQCPCTHNGIQYRSGDIVQVDCNSCQCKNRLWTCTEQQCHGTCVAYGDGNYITFDGKRYNFDGDCEYIVAQDYCGNMTSNGTFRIITENMPCGTTGTTCSKSIKIFLGNFEIKLSDGKFEVVKFSSRKHIPYEVRYLGIYLVIEMKNGLVLIWDKKTSLTIKLSHSFKGTICGLCGNYDGNVQNDFTTRNQLVVVNAEEFGNSWKVSSSCTNVKKNKNPCSVNTHRDAWAQKQCSIIKNGPFKACNVQINPAPYYEACVHDACACDTGGDCECLCTAIAAYSLACSMVGVCISWRSPEVCPLFCDYYNPHDECRWHYAPCGISCLKTCQNPGGACSKIIPKLEGCYPDCPADKPILDEERMKCVKLDHCPCYINGNHYEPGQTVPSTQNCESCKCINSEVRCTYDKSECTCVYDGKTFHEGDIIYHTTDGIGGCIKATCSVNGTIIRKANPCTPKASAIPSTTLTFETTPPLTASGTRSSTTMENKSEQSETTPPTSSATTITSTIYIPTKTAHVTVTTTAETALTNTKTITPTTLLSTMAKNTETTSEQSQPTSATSSSTTITVTPTTTLASTTSSATTAAIPTTTSKSLTSSSTATTTVIPITTASSTISLPTTSKTVIPITTSTSATSSPTTSTTVVLTTSTLMTSSPITSTYTGKCETTTAPTTTPETTTVTVTPTTTETTTCSCTDNGQILSPGQAIYTGKCETTTVPTTTPETTTVTVTPTTTETTTCSCTANGQILSPGQAIYTGKCETTTAPTTTPETTTVTVTPTTTETTTCSCTDNGQILSPECFVMNVVTVHFEKRFVVSIGLQMREAALGEMYFFMLYTSETMIPDFTFTFTHQWLKTLNVSTRAAHLHFHIALTFLPFKSDLEMYSIVVLVVLNYTGKCETTTAPTTTPETTTVTVTPTTTETTTCSCTDNGQILSPGQATVSSAGKSGLCNFTLCTKSCELLKYTGKCETTTAPTTTPESTTVTVTPTTTETTTCSCTANGKILSPGETVYNTTDKAGWCFYALCSENCKIMKHMEPCKNITLSQPTTQTSTVMTAPPKGCSALQPSRAVNETWKLDNCTMGICTGNNTVSVIPLKCPHVKSVTCQNGLQPKRIYDQSGCCYHYECDCVCTGWGGSHYLTFDGTDYTFQGNCTYILMKQIKEIIKGFKITIDDYFCDAEKELPCPKTIIVFYKSSVITLIRTTVNDTVKIKALVNGKEIIPSYYHDGIRISSSGIAVKAEIVAINSTVTFNGKDFTIDIPYKIFGENVEGQCGTCTNSKKDDCTLPDGTVVSSCSYSAPFWQTENKKKPHCETRPLTTTPPPIHHSTPPRMETTTLMPTVPTTPCAASDICKIILGPAFSKCHDIVLPKPYYEACVRDSCHNRNKTIICSSLEIYSKICQSKGDICVNWREHANGSCQYHCPATMEYKSCESKEQPTCSSRYTDKNAPIVKSGHNEGCFCPAGKILFAPLDICVDICECIGPDGKPRQIGETWSSNCQDCFCNNATLSIVCKPRKCPTLPPVRCKGPGLVPVADRSQSESCCTKIQCECNVTFCPTVKFDCKPGYKPVLHVDKGECCPDYTCEPKSVCVHNGTEYKPGMTIPQGPCENCKCTNKTDSSTKHKTIECTAIKCDTHCPVGFKYKKVEGQCCGNCTQVDCILELPNGRPVILQPGATASDPRNNCTKYECKKIKSHLISSIHSKWCPQLDHNNCEPGTIRKDLDGCCQTCIPKTCTVTQTTTYINHNGCRTKQKVPVTYCEGYCKSNSVYSAETNTMLRNCTCCQELATGKQDVMLLCPDGTTIDFTYTYVKNCGCVAAKCEEGTKQLSEPPAPPAPNKLKNKV
ncbi:mucin-5B-like [Cetorhinus maximus]